MTNQQNAGAKPAATTKRAVKRADDQKYAVLLHYIAGRISAYPGGNDMNDLIGDLTRNQGLKLYEKPKGSGRYVARMHGIATKPAATQAQAVRLWANKARRVARQEG